ALGDPPEDVPGLVTADAEVDRLERGEVVGPRLLAGAFPPLSDGVPEEDHVALALRDNLQELLVPGDVPVERLGGRVVLVVPGPAGFGGYNKGECQQQTGRYEAASGHRYSPCGVVGPWVLDRCRDEDRPTPRPGQSEARRSSARSVTAPARRVNDFSRKP